jgi:hypothetical protein
MVISSSRSISVDGKLDEREKHGLRDAEREKHRLRDVER